jgi:DNA-binding NtrC family response regulator
VVAGPDTGLTANLSLSNVRIGTATDNDLVLGDPTVSRHHAEIRMTPTGLVLRDLGSTNGTFINQLRVTEAYLEPGTECVLGYSRIAIRQRMEERRVSPSRQNSLGSLVGSSAQMRELYGLLQAVAPTPVTVHITGESGSGKELVARTVHELSGRSGPLVVFDASVTDPEMVRNDLFGHVKGAFTGATGNRDGAFRQANQGTLFIDEIGELPLDLQPRLLRVLENREVTPIGTDKPIRVDVRVVTATHRDLDAMVKEGTFRADLFYRLCVVPLEVPPLRKIREDIPLLVETLCERQALTCKVSADAMAALQAYDWPGNVRELRNVLERAAIFCRDRAIQPQDLRLPATSPEDAAPSQTPGVNTPVGELAASSPTSRSEMGELERRMIMEAMERNHNNKTAVARELGLALSTLKRRLKEYQDDGEPSP